MCLLGLALHPNPRSKLVLLSHRDEQFVRPTAGLHHWPSVAMVAGKDLSAGGTWLGFARHGRFAALTNRPDIKIPAEPVSRGEIIVEYLTSNLSPSTFLTKLNDRRMRYAGFNLIVADANAILQFNYERGTWLSCTSGIVILSNNPSSHVWPKLVKARSRFEQACSLHGFNWPNRSVPPEWMYCLDDRAERDTGHLDTTNADYQNSLFIQGATYGTRTISAAHWDGQQFTVSEQSFNAQGQLLASTTLCI